MKMNGLTRSLRYAGFRAGRVLGTAILMTAGFVLYFTLIAGEAFSMQNLVTRLPETVLFVGALIFMIYGMLDLVTYTQLTLSYGSTRKDAMISVIYMDLLQIVGMLLVVYLIFTFAPAAWMPMGTLEACALAQNIFFIASSIALMNGMLIYRFGKVAYYIFTFLAAVISGAVAGFTTFMGKMSVLGNVFRIGGLSVFDLIGVVLFVIASVICWLFIRKIEVRV